MCDTVDFDINAALKSYLDDPSSIITPEADPALLDCESDPDSFSPGLINSVLNPIVDAVSENPEAIARSSTFDSLQFLLKCAPISRSPPGQGMCTSSETDFFARCRQCSSISSSSLGKVLDLVVGGIAQEAEIIHSEEQDGEETSQQHKQTLEIFAYLLQWCVAAVETKSAEKPANAPAARGKGAKGAKAKAGASKDGSWNPETQLQTALNTMTKVMKLKLAKIFVTTSERDTFISLFTRPVYLILESEARVKSVAIRMHAFKVLCVAVKHHGHAYGKTSARLLDRF